VPELKRPTLRSKQGKRKRIDPSPDRARLQAATQTAIYRSSDYHCRGAKGQPPKRRTSPTSICPRAWRDREATDALRKALLKGHTSDVWDGEFPRYVWHKEGEVVYEARHTRGPVGCFHAYPIESFQIPSGFDK
jgi:hypothetical protein